MMRPSWSRLPKPQRSSKMARRLVAFRDINGYEIELARNTDAAVFDNIPKVIIAQYVRCPETDHLLAREYCKMCKFNDGCRPDGQWCKSEKPYVCDWYDKYHKVIASRILLEPYKPKR